MEIQDRCEDSNGFDVDAQQFYKTNTYYPPGNM